jgi:hypothetical protein
MNPIDTRATGCRTLELKLVKSRVFCIIAFSNPLKMKGHLGEIRSLHHQDRKVKQARNQRESSTKNIIICFKKPLNA